MKIIIFAGGAGTRLWPLSRKNFPKQFIQMFDGKSTIQLMVDRVKEPFGIENVYISTNEKYKNLVTEQLPEILEKNIVTEPEKRNVAPAIGYNLIKLRHEGYKGPVAILWSDHLMDRVDDFVKMLKKAEKMVEKNPDKICFVGETPRFANNNLGWIHVGKEVEEGIFSFIEWQYKPPVEKCNQMFDSKEWLWNPGYFILDLEHTISLYEKLVPEMYKGLQKIEEAIGTDDEEKVLKEIYPTLESIHFDNAIAERIPADGAVVVKSDLGWSDPGTLYALKEAIEKNLDKNVTEGNVAELDAKDSIIINKDQNRLTAVIGLEGFVVINMQDVTLVVHKDKVLDISKIVEKIGENPDWARFL